MNTTKTIAAFAVASLASVPIANAAFVGEVWQDTPAAGNVSLTPSGEHASFTVDALSGGVNVDQNPATYTTGGFLATFPGFSGFSSASAGFDPNAPMSASGLNSSGPNIGDFYRFTGPVEIAAGVNSFSVTHDDGVMVEVAGYGRLLSSGPTPPRNDVFTFDNTGAATVADVTVSYGECCRGAAVLDTNLQVPAAPVSPVSEPGSLALLGVMLAFLGLRGRSRMTSCA